MVLNFDLRSFPTRLLVCVSVHMWDGVGGIFDLAITLACWSRARIPSPSPSSRAATVNNLGPGTLFFFTYSFLHLRLAQSLYSNDLWAQRLEVTELTIPSTDGKHMYMYIHIFMHINIYLRYMVKLASIKL
jgi:hypothetical protein